MHNRYRIRKFKCLGCGNIVQKKRLNNQTKYCSMECYRISKRPQRKTGAFILCDICNKEIWKFRYLLNNHKNHFCSKECANKYQARNKIKIICKTCKKKFYISKCYVKRKYLRKYCSIKCRNNDPDYDGHIKANIAQQNKKGLNKIEKIGHEILEELEIQYKEQVLIANKFLVDAFIPSVNIVIQWDGDYWHGYNINKIDDRIKKRMILDKGQDAYMKKCGYVVLRFWEHELKNNKNKVYNNIKEIINKKRLAQKLLL